MVQGMGDLRFGIAASFFSESCPKMKEGARKAVGDRRNPRSMVLNCSVEERH